MMVRRQDGEEATATGKNHGGYVSDLSRREI
jgi:hypothetical protein